MSNTPWTSSNLDASSTAADLGEQRVITAIAGEALTGGQVVELTANNTVKASTLTTTCSSKVLGVCLTSQANAGKAISVIRFGLVRITAYGTLNPGDNVGAAPGGWAQNAIANGSAGTGTIIGKVWVGSSSGGTAIVLLHL